MDHYLPSGIDSQDMLEDVVFSSQDDFGDIFNMSHFDFDLKMDQELKNLGMGDWENLSSYSDAVNEPVGYEKYFEESPVASFMNMSSMANYSIDLDKVVNPSMVLPTKQSVTESASQKPVNNTNNSYPSISSGISLSKQDDVYNVVNINSVDMSSGDNEGAKKSVLGRLPKTEFSDSITNPTIVTTSTLTTPTIQSFVQHPSITTTTTNSNVRNITYGINKGNPTIRNTVNTIKQDNRINRIKQPTKYRSPSGDGKVYPKPAYSYSCLIALALKNSATGSLPVSEIYSFMCDHFPYFRTAPNGWKNSVRHNLSLNKCFEKIEKPPVSGSNQRKGCLWALNPEKLHKMDEEVQKWSKKGLHEIKEAMSFPDVLESLERGEMKFDPASGASSCSEDEEEEEEKILVKEALPPIKILNPIQGQVLLGGQKVERALQAGSTMRSNINLQNGTIFSIKQQTFRQGPKPVVEFRHISKSSPSGSEDSPEQSDFNLPDSTMGEISIQSDGTLYDDYRNHVTVGGDKEKSSFFVKKVDMKGGSQLLYAPQHTTALNRLLLTNSKIS